MQTPVARNRTRPRSARRRARELALQGIYAWLVRGNDDPGQAGEIDAHLRDTDGFGRADTPWYDMLLYGVVKQAPGLREQFMPHVDRALTELSPIEHAILLIGSYELVYLVEVPYRVAINEAVELAKSYGGTDGFKFVNGVLDKVALQVRSAEIEAASKRRRPN